MGLSTRELVALSHLIGGARTAYTGPFAVEFADLLSETWELYIDVSSGNVQYKAKGKELYILQTDYNLLLDAEMLTIVQEFASDRDAFLSVFEGAWPKLLNADRFDGPVDSVCKNTATKPVEKGLSKGLSAPVIAGIAIGCIALVGAAAYMASGKSGSRDSDYKKGNDELRLSLALQQEHNNL
jgi:catalase (peroxidase I)